MLTPQFDELNININKDFYKKTGDPYQLGSIRQAVQKYIFDNFDVSPNNFLVGGYDYFINPIYNEFNHILISNEKIFKRTSINTNTNCYCCNCIC